MQVFFNNIYKFFTLMLLSLTWQTPAYCRCQSLAGERWRRLGIWPPPCFLTKTRYNREFVVDELL